MHHALPAELFGLP
uniref:Uncharacterized protein n=1 Tax=Anguilla anguilla TaxID=7936 RepID=A0A0E9QI39_ANGAN